MAFDGEYLIEIQGLRTQFGRIVVHDQLELKVRRGEILSVVGGSGTGKTVLMRQMLGLEQPARGRIRIFGEDLHSGDQKHLQYLRQRSGMLFQHGALYSALTVYDNVAQPLRELGRLPEDLIRDMVYLKLQMVNIGLEHARKMPSDLSGGMVKRVALARALALDPELLFLDEPTAGLDPDRSDSFVLREGMGRFTVGQDTIEFGPGVMARMPGRMEGEAYTWLNGNLRVEGYRVYLTGITPFQHTLTIR